MSEPLRRDMFEELCPSVLLPLRFTDKWAPLVLVCLADGPRRFSELRVPLHRTTAKVLTHTLRALQRDGLITRTERPGPTPHVEYALTPLGRGLLEPLAVVCAWTEKHWEELMAAREAYAETTAAARP
ncbi:winged helix-turn-helix transcriptional regulator [Streptomyces avicenniae]|uniref:winged helix-turn-helix transcriptional regulator n=1 Tax=Streptomyces avicenniae TaxID=500153 RepID=UPI00069A9D94|nr:helix-turn-helix domain-containing protein [Streptomyces avicenniae]